MSFALDWLFWSFGFGALYTLVVPAARTRASSNTVYSSLIHHSFEFRPLSQDAGRHLATSIADIVCNFANRALRERWVLAAATSRSAGCLQPVGRCPRRI